MQNVGYIPNTFEDQMIHLLDEKRQMFMEAIVKLTPRELEIIRMKYYESMTTAEVAKSLELSAAWVYNREQDALRKLRHIILKHRTEVVDSKIGMKENDWEYLASSIAGWLELQSTSKNSMRGRQGVLAQWAKDIIMWRLTSDERQILLWAHHIMPYPGKYNQEYYDTVNEIRQKILKLLLEDDLVVQKTAYKVRVP